MVVFRRLAWKEVHSPADRTVDLFPENVGMTGVPARLFDHVHEDHGRLTRRSIQPRSR